MTRKQTITIDKTQHDNMKKQVNEYEKLFQKYKAQEKELKEAKKAKADAEEDAQSKQGQIELLETEMAGRDKWIEAAKGELTSLKANAKDMEDALHKSGADKLFNRKDDLVRHVTDVTKSVLFRNWKFVEDESDLVEATTDLIPYLTIDKQLDDETFITYYKDIVQTSLNQLRNYIQGECKKRAKGMSLSCVYVLFFL